MMMTTQKCMLMIFLSGAFIGDLRFHYIGSTKKKNCIENRRLKKKEIPCLEMKPIIM